MCGGLITQQTTVGRRRRVGRGRECLRRAMTRGFLRMSGQRQRVMSRRLGPVLMAHPAIVVKRCALGHVRLGLDGESRSVRLPRHHVSLLLHFAFPLQFPLPLPLSLPMLLLVMQNIHLLRALWHYIHPSRRKRLSWEPAPGRVHGSNGLARQWHTLLCSFDFPFPMPLPLPLYLALSVC